MGCGSSKGEPTNVRKADANEDLYEKSEVTQRPSMMPGDVQRALICSDAVYRSDDQAKKQFFDKKGNLHNFERVRVSRDDGVRYLLAETRNNEDVFLAFKGTSNFKDVMTNQRTWMDDTDGIEGEYHDGFLGLAENVPVHRILEEYSNSRIVVCGHSLGGAVAHIVALKMMAHLRSNEQPVDNVKSIAFGAPFFGNKAARQFAEEHNLSPRLLTIVNVKDPVPYILRLAESLQSAGLSVGNEVRSVAEEILDLLSKIFAQEDGSTITDKLKECKRKLEEQGFSAPDLDSPYVPIGWYLCMSRSMPCCLDAVYQRILLTDPVTTSKQFTAPDIRAWTKKDISRHSRESYYEALFEIVHQTKYRQDDAASQTSDISVTDAIFLSS